MGWPPGPNPTPWVQLLDPTLPINPTQPGNPWVEPNPAATLGNTIKAIQQLHAQLSRDINFVNLCTARYYNKNHQEGPDLKKGEKVFLLQKNIKIKRLSQKLNYPKLGPFLINEKLGPVNYWLQLPDTMQRIHPMFYILLLEPVPRDATLVENIELTDKTKEYKVKQVLDMQMVNN